GRIVQRQPAGRAMALPAPVQGPDNGLDLLAGDRAGAQQGDATVQHRDNRALDAHGAVAAIDQRRGESPRLLDRVGEGGGAGAAGPVGGGGDDRTAEGGDDGAGASVAGDADGDAVQTGAGQVADPLTVPDGGHKRQRTGPE